MPTDGKKKIPETHFCLDTTPSNTTVSGWNPPISFNRNVNVDSLRDNVIFKVHRLPSKTLFQKVPYWIPLKEPPSGLSLRNSMGFPIRVLGDGGAGSSLSLTWTSSHTGQAPPGAWTPVNDPDLRPPHHTSLCSSPALLILHISPPPRNFQASPGP